MSYLIFLVILFLLVISYSLFLLYKSKKEYDELIDCIVWEELTQDE